MKLKEGFVLREVAGECVVIPAGEMLDLNMMITLNETGKLLWEKLEKGAEESELTDALLEEYDVEKSEAEKHVSAFVNKLKENGFFE